MKKTDSTTATKFFLAVALVLIMASALPTGAETAPAGKPDKVAPSAPTGLTAKAISATRIDLFWKEPPGKAKVTSCKIYRNNGLLASVDKNKISDIGLEPGTKYTYRIAACDADLIQSPFSAEASATTYDDLDKMVLVRAGKFQMGENLRDYNTIPNDAPDFIRTKEENAALPLRMVYVSSFYITKYETTYEKWHEIYKWARANGYNFGLPPYNVIPVGQSGSQGKGNHMPVTMIQWYDAVKWLNARSEKEKLTPCYYTDASRNTVYRQGQIDLPQDAIDWHANGYRLPTEAEWEKAARGGLTGKRYPWGGNKLDTGKGNFPESKIGGTTPVGSYSPNGYGLYDMAGNVWELTGDFWASGYNPTELRDPKGPPTGGMRVRRGGSWEHPGFPCASCAYRGELKAARAPNYAPRLYYGFRAVKRIKGDN